MPSPVMQDTQPRKFNRLLTIQTMPETKNATTGEITPTPTFFCQRWAYIAPLVGRELLIAKEVQADVTHEIGMYSDSVTRTVTPQMRVVYTLGTQTRIFNILYVLNLAERDRRMMLLCKEQV